MEQLNGIEVNERFISFDQNTKIGRLLNINARIVSAYTFEYTRCNLINGNLIYTCPVIIYTVVFSALS